MYFFGIFCLTDTLTNKIKLLTFSSVGRYIRKLTLKQYQCSDLTFPLELPLQFYMHIKLMYVEGGRVEP